jgi:hypothetical protein
LVAGISIFEEPAVAALKFSLAVFFLEASSRLAFDGGRINALRHVASLISSRRCSLA